MKGGARTNSGPPPDPNSRRQQTRGQASGWVDLPAEGRAESAPDWPLATSTDHEVGVWESLWALPQAKAWEMLQIPPRVVALYVRFSVRAEGDGAEATKAATEARQAEDRLGLNPAAMLRNRWRIKADDLAEKRIEKAPAKRRALKVAPDAVGS